MKKQLINKIEQFGFLTTCFLILKAVIRIIFKISWHSSYLMYQRLSMLDTELPDDITGDNIQIKRLELHIKT
jgi:hypothetical protein